MRSQSAIGVGNAPVHSVHTAEVSGFASRNAASIVISNVPNSSTRRRNFSSHREADLGNKPSHRGATSETVDGLARGPQIDVRDAEYHYKLACVMWSANQTDGVERHLLEAARLDPRSPSIHEALALWFLRYDKVQAALKHSTFAVTLTPNNPFTVITHADVLAAKGDLATAWNLIAPLVVRGAGQPWLARMYAKLAPKIGRETQAAEFLEKTLRTSALGLSPSDKERIHFAAAGLYDAIGRYDQAFGHATMAKKFNSPVFDAVDDARGVTNQIHYFTKQHLASLPHATNSDGRPIFIVGMPRSGTSLVEQILASHPAVFGAGELTTLSEISAAATSARWAEGTGFPECFDRMSLHNAEELAGQYLSKINAFSASATCVTDKMPMNYLFLGVAAALLPRCRVIHCVRDAKDTCLSCYLTDFGNRQPYTSNMADLASVYRNYRRLMDHWKKVLPLPILEVRYEDIVADQEGQTRRMLQFLDLPFDHRCMQFHQTNRPIATASREQVRRPIYASSVRRWQHYRKHISEFMKL